MWGLHSCHHDWATPSTLTFPTSLMCDLVWFSHWLREVSRGSKRWTVWPENMQQESESQWAGGWDWTSSPAKPVPSVVGKEEAQATPALPGGLLLLAWTLPHWGPPTSHPTSSPQVLTPRTLHNPQTISTGFLLWFSAACFLVSALDHKSHDHTASAHQYWVLDLMRIYQIAEWIHQWPNKELS